MADPRGASPRSDPRSPRHPARPGRGSIPAPRAPRGRRRTQRLVIALACGLVVVGALFAFVYPTRTYLQQRRDITAAERRLAVLAEHERDLVRDNARLQTDDEVERRAREDYGFVRPGETPYVLVPAPTVPPLP